MIDSHVHLGGPDKGDGASLSPEELIRRMDAAGVDRAVVFPFNEIDPGISFSKANDFTAQAVAMYPERLIGFARLDPNDGEICLIELDRAVSELGLRGVKLHPKGQNFTSSNSYVRKILDRAGALGVPIVFDNGKAIFNNHDIGWLASQCMDTKIIMAHMRGEGFIDVPLEHENVFLGTVKARARDVAKALETLGPEKIIAGSDTPYTDMAYELKFKFNELESLSKRDMGLVRGGNILRLITI